MPLLRELKLNNSALSSVRDLGSKLWQLQVAAWCPVSWQSSASAALAVSATCMHLAGTLGFTLWLDRTKWVERSAKPQRAVRSLQPHRQSGTYCRQAAFPISVSNVSALMRFPTPVLEVTASLGKWTKQECIVVCTQSVLAAIAPEHLHDEAAMSSHI